ncbi:MAG: EAL domain-containing protein [Succinimonas sp.]|nr:EAL domain-containing protein [Succinimonas sp.]
MSSIKTKITAMTVGVVVTAMVIAAFLGVTAIRDIGNHDAEQTLLLLCETGQKDLNSFFQNAEQSVKAIGAYAESDLAARSFPQFDLPGTDDEKLRAHTDRVRDVFKKLAYNTHGVLTYYYRIDPGFSRNVPGFWYVNTGDGGFQEHEVTDITGYDTSDTSQLVWFTVPKATGKGVWLPPYITENLNARVLSYNVPIYHDGHFVGVIGIEIDYSAMAEVVNHITLYDNGYAFLNDSEGNIVYHPQIDVTAMETQPRVPDGLLSNDKFIRYSFDGAEKQAVWLKLVNGMRLNVSVPVNEINAVWNKWILEITVAFALLLVIFIELVRAFTGRITSPLQTLTSAAKQIGKGNYDTELSYEGNDEVGVLTASFKTLISDLKEYIRNLREMAYIDALTGVGNRMALRRDYDSYREREVTVFMVDLNDFKLINDTYGHETGDRVLHEVGKLLKKAFGKEHCYRYGGDEFLIIAPDLSPEEIKEKEEFLKKNEPVISKDGKGSDNGNDSQDPAKASFSVGYVRARLTDAAALRHLICLADEKMYDSKRNRNHTLAAGRNAVGSVPDPEMRSSEYTVQELRAYLKAKSQKHALARVVDPIECRIIELGEDGSVNMTESCYGIWNSKQKCLNCSSALACRTGCPQHKAEHFKDRDYFVESQPVKLKLSNGSVCNAVVELVNTEKGNAANRKHLNNREAENTGSAAARYLAQHDSLTSVLNADAFYELARELLKKIPAQSWVMITSNIMNFRLINTLFGEQKGNEVLAKTASLLKELAESAGGLCGRIGSDQFAVLIPESVYKEERLTSIVRALKDTYDSGIYRFCIHFGVYEITDTAVPVSVMCGRANSALRMIREDLTRAVASFDDAILEKIVMEQTVLGSFDEALRSGQIRMYLQPLVRKDGSIIGAEALARWIRPDGSLLMPGDFIETLETAGLIHRLDRYMWEQAVKQLSQWELTEKSDLFISVNVSAKDFYSIDVPREITGLVTKYGADSSKLRLEITETALLGEPDSCDSIVAELRQRGFLVEIDDFGKDNSTLNLLKDIKADVLKIDMSFLAEIGDNERNRIILKSVIGMADALGMDVITEGVETEDELSILAEMGCNHFQGYLFSRPVPVDEFEKKFSAAEQNAG